MTRLRADLSPHQVSGDNTDIGWWKRAVFYQIYPRSFADGNGDGIGDIVGVTNKLDYLARLGVDALWFSPFYPSPQHDHGYDVADYFDVNPEYGTLEELQDLVNGAHDRNMRVIIDVVPNHSSSEHKWFQEALQAKPGSPERDRYTFRYSETGCPNNWGSMFGGPAWTNVESLTGNPEDHNWWYLHLFDSRQPDFNWDNRAVQEMFDDYLRFWCDRGVDGFRVDVAHGLIKAEGLPDDEIGPERYEYIAPGGDGEMTRAPDRGPYFDQESVHDVYRRWRKILNEYGPDRMLVAEAWTEDPDRTARYVRPDEMSQVFNFDILLAGWNAAEVRTVLKRTTNANGKVGAVNTWVMSNHDVVRHPSRLGYPYGAYLRNGIGPTDPQPDASVGLARALGMTTFLMAMPGAIYLYNGEELGLPEVTDIPDERRTDPTWERSGKRVWGRDGCRVPLPWESGAAHCGFGGVDGPWLPQPAGWEQFAVDLQETDPTSVLNHYRRTISKRRDLGLALGNFELLESHKDLVVVRNGKHVVAMNMGVAWLELPYQGTVVHTSSTDPQVNEVFRINQGELTLAPHGTVWIELP